MSELEAENSRLRRALANAALDAQVATIHRDSRRSYGRPRITQQLRQQGRGRVTEMMAHLGPQGALKNRLLELLKDTFKLGRRDRPGDKLREQLG